MATPKVLKLMRQINKAETTLCSMEPKPYGGSNPYYYCSSCEKSMIEVSYQGHRKGCSYAQLENKIKSLKGTLKGELRKFLENKEYNSKAYKNYIWFKQEMYVDGLRELNIHINKEINL